MAVLYANNAASRLSASITSTATSFSVTPGDGEKFPALIVVGDYFYATLMDTAGNVEVVKVIAQSVDTFTVQRANDGTTARAFSVNDVVELRITKAMLDDFKTDTRGGNAASATRLQINRTINGTSFNGSADITTASWGTARDINGTSVDGSGNYAIGRIYDTNYRRITNPGGAEYVNQTATVTGAIAVTLPVGMTNTMVRITIKVYEYATNESFEVHCGGYNYQPTASWSNSPFAYIVGNPSIDRRFTVRFGYDSVALKAVVYIGELTSTWSIPQVYVTEVLCGYSGQQAAWTTGWSIGFEATAFKTITAAVTNSQVGYAVSTNTANSTVLRDGSGNFSAGTITAALTGNASTATTLQVARTINGVSFNGSANITVADSTKLPLAGGTLTGELVVNVVGNNTQPSVNGARFNGYGILGNRTAPLYITNGGGGGVQIGVGTLHSVEEAMRFTSSQNTSYKPLFEDLNRVLHAGNYSDYAASVSHTQPWSTITGKPIDSATFNVIVNATTYWTITRPNGGAIAAGLIYRITLLTLGTGTDTGEQYLLSNVNSAGWAVKAVARNGSSNNYGIVFVDGDVPKVKTEHQSDYTLRVIVEEIDTGNLNGGLISAFGLEGYFSSDLGSPKYRATWNGSDYTLLHSDNYNSYAPTLTGTGASGSWGISVTGSSGSTTGNAATATTLQTARTINGTSFDGSANITTATWGTARTLTIGNTGKSVNGSANVAWSLDEIGAELKPTLNTPRVNLGIPTVQEMAIIDGQFDNKIERYDITKVFVETSTDNVTWTAVSITDAQKRILIGGDTSNSTLAIPYGTAYFRIRMRAASYVYLNAFYSYCSTQGHTTRVKIFRKHDLDSNWTAVANSTATVSSWPGHLYLPHSTIPWHPTATQGSHNHEVYVVFEPVWNATYPSNSIVIQKIQWWGGYPSGRRNVYSTDEFGNVAFPAALSAVGAITQNGNQVLHASNYGGYALPLTGGSLTGNLGIGTSTPAQKLHVYGNIEFGGTSIPYLISHRNSVVSSAVSLGFIEFAGDTAATSMCVSASIRAYADGAWTDTSYPSNLRFMTTASGQETPTERMRIDSSGNLGIGTTTPPYKLVVSNGGASGIEFGPAFSGTANLIQSYNRSGAAYVATVYDAELHRFNTIGVEKMRLDADGNLGIGTSSPAAKLDVSANASIMGYFRSSGGSANDIRFTITSGGDRAVLDAAQNSTGAARDVVFATGGTERIRLLSTGNLGIGTSSPGYKLTVAGTSGTAAINLLETGVRSWAIRAGGVATNTFDIADLTAGATRLTINATGNFGFGVTPSSWEAAHRSIELPGNGHLVGVSGSVIVGHNYYWNGTNNIYKGAGRASSYTQSNGGHFWRTAPIGSSGATFSFDATSMTLSNAGVLTLGVNTVLHAGNYATYALPLSGGTVTGLTAFTNSRVQVSGGGVAMLELHVTGLHARGLYLDNAGVTRLAQTNAAGVASTIYLTSDGSGNLTAAGNVSGNSDERLKKDWSALSADFIERLATVKSGTYTRIDSGERQAGSSAQDWQELLPEVVSQGTDEAKTLALAYGNAALVSAVELAKRVVSQEARIKQLEILINKLIGE